MTKPRLARGATCLAVVLWASLAGADASDPLEVARGLHREGRWQEALAAYRAVASEADTASAAIAHNNACTILNTLADYPAALTECQQALRLRRGLDDERRLARTLNNLAITLQYLGRFDEAALTYREALAINQRRGDLEAQAINHQNLGLVANSAGRYREALEDLAAAEALTESHAEEPWARRQNQLVRFNRGVVLEKLGAYRQALEIYRQLLDERDELDPGHLASLQVNLGVIYRNLGDPVRAIQAFEGAAVVYEQSGDVAALSNTTLNMALAWHLNLGQLEDAERAYRRALELAQASGDRSEEIQDLFYLGRLLLDLGRLDEAETAFDACLEAAEVSGSAEGRWSALFGLGQTAAARGLPHLALEYLEKAALEIEKVRAELTGGLLRSGYFGDKRPVYADAVSILADLEQQEPGAGHAERALDIVQRTKSRELLESLGSERQATPLTTPELIELSAERVILEYFVANDRLFLWVIRRGGIRFEPLGPVAPIFARVLEIHQALAAGREPASATLQTLARELTPGLETELRRARRLHVAADGRLHYLPFEILPAPGSTGELLLERLEITYLPNASARTWLDQRPRRAGLMLSGFGDPRLTRPADRRDALTRQITSRFNLGPLPAAARELAKISGMLPGEHELHIGDRATEQAFRLAASRGARIIHLATHTIVDERLGQGAAIVLAATDGDDGLLRPVEIAAMDFRADLAVLAACRSALGEVEDGRAFASLTGSFLAAGSSAVVASLWDVGDEASAVFMEQFYYQLSRGYPPAKALRRAKLRLRSDPTWNRPDLWAAFILIGDAPRLVRAPNLFLWGLIATALGLGGLAVFRSVRARSGRSAPGGEIP